MTCYNLIRDEVKGCAMNNLVIKGYTSHYFSIFKWHYNIVVGVNE